MLDLQTWSVKNSQHFGPNLTSSLHISLTFRFCQLQDKYKSGLLSTFLEYDHESIGLWNWEKCLGWLRHWHCAKQVPECRTSISHTKLVELTPVLIWIPGHTCHTYWHPTDTYPSTPASRPYPHCHGSSPRSSMSLWSLASTSDGSTHLQCFQISLRPNWVIGLLLILSHRLLYVSIFLLYLILSILLVYISIPDLRPWLWSRIPDFWTLSLTAI